MRKLTLGALALGLAAVLAVGAAGGRQAVKAGTVFVVAKGLDNPREVSVAQSGAVYVAEAGKAGPQCISKDTCIGMSSKVVRVNGQAVTTVAGNLFSAGGKDGTFSVGADGVAIAHDGSVFVQQTAIPDCAPSKGFPPAIKAQSGELFRFDHGKLNPVVNIGALECAHNYDHTDRNADPYAVMAITPVHAVVADAGANVIYDVRGTTAKVLAVLPKLKDGGQAVPTSLTVGPGGKYFVGVLGGDPPKGHKRLPHVSNVYEIDPSTGAVSVFASGFDNVTGVAFDGTGNLYVTELTINPANQNEFRGEVVKVEPNNGPRSVMGLGKLFAPQGAAVGPDGYLYVSNFSVLTGTPAAAGPFKGLTGELVKISL